MLSSREKDAVPGPARYYVNSTSGVTVRIPGESRMAELKTRPTDISPSKFISGIEDEGSRKDCRMLLKLMKEVTGKAPRMWGSSIVGFGNYHYRYRSGLEGDWFLTGFAPRKRDLTIYIMPGFSDYSVLMARLGKFRTGRSCLYVRKLDDIDLVTLRQLVEQSIMDMQRMYECR